ncbi:MAG TPA: AraC family transcriptional regulator [Candidatus Blautia merdigallinarum]|uniref:AraC family transcriptional regulator n=1 Tax=Candidatus Blautia merdigallinarum TaxID=2838495 RepID=A0A9D2SIA0_9FIRM|nr:AraC family transcriptional regulator [Candidatus Blautia merdigallinarum]
MDKSKMLYCTAKASYPAEFLTCGNLVSDGGFLHQRRRIDAFVLILVCRGTLHINQSGRNIDVHENETLLLFPHQLHYGYAPSEGKLSYYWVHFHMTDPQSSIVAERDLQKARGNWNHALLSPLSSSPESFILPESGRLSMEKRTLLLFVQLLDIAKRENYQSSWRTRYALNLLLLEFSSEVLSLDRLLEDRAPGKLLDMIEWLRSHYDQPVTVEELAARFHYHPAYLTSLMKKYTGYSVNTYVNHIRLAAAKNLLCQGEFLSVAAVAHTCGFPDEKYFMRLFKKQEGMTPSQYRQAFRQKSINTR